MHAINNNITTMMKRAQRQPLYPPPTTTAKGAAKHTELGSENAENVDTNFNICVGRNWKRTLVLSCSLLVVPALSLQMFLSLMSDAAVVKVEIIAGVADTFPPGDGDYYKLPTRAPRGPRSR